MSIFVKKQLCRYSNLKQNKISIKPAFHLFSMKQRLIEPEIHYWDLTIFKSYLPSKILLSQFHRLISYNLFHDAYYFAINRCNANHPSIYSFHIHASTHFYTSLHMIDLQANYKYHDHASVPPSILLYTLFHQSI